MQKSFVRLFALLLVECGGLVGVVRAQGAGSERGAFTVADLSLYVDKTGDDSNDCTFPGKAACLTIQGAVNKVPKRLRHNVTITVAPGTFAGAVIEGFSVESSNQPNRGAGLDIRGTLLNAELAKGPVTGTATNCDGGGYGPPGEYNNQGIRGGLPSRADSRVHATLTKTDAGWTPRTLRGKFLVLTDGPGAGQILAIEDNTVDVITLAGYWDDYHSGWVNCAPNFGEGGQSKHSTFAIQEPGTIIDQDVTLPAGIGGIGKEQTAVEHWAAFIASNLRGGATSHYIIPGDHTQYMIQRFKIDQSLRSVLFVDSSENVSARYMSSIRLSGGSALYLGQNSSNWSVMSSYSQGVPLRSDTFAGVSRLYTADTQIAMFGNVIDGGGSYFGDQVDNITNGRVSVQFNGESIRHLVGDGGHEAAIHIRSGGDIHIVGTLIDGFNPDASRQIADCIRLGDGRGGDSGHLYFESGEVKNCGSAGLSAFGNWIVVFIDLQVSGGGNGRFGLQASNGAKVFGLDPKKVTITGKFDDMTFDNNHGFSYSTLVAAETIHDTQGGFFATGYLSSNPATAQTITYLDGTQIKSGGFGVPVVHGPGGVLQAMEVGHATLNGGNHTVTFVNAFSAMPECVCTNQSGVRAVQCKATAAQLTITASGNDTVSYQCFGNK